MNRPPIVIQDIFLNQVRKENVNVEIELLDGSSISGYIKGFDSFVIIVDRGAEQAMIYKSAIACIRPERTAFYSNAPAPVRDVRDVRDMRDVRDLRNR